MFELKEEVHISLPWRVKTPYQYRKAEEKLSYLNPLKPGIKYEGKIRFHNFTEFELGKGVFNWCLIDGFLHEDVDVDKYIENIKRFLYSDAGGA